MNDTPDEGFTDEDHTMLATPLQEQEFKLLSLTSLQQREDLVYTLLQSLPRSRLAKIQGVIAPLLQVDIIGTVPTEIALNIFAQLSWRGLLKCALVCKRWRTLTDDPSLWKLLCDSKGWEWKQPSRLRGLDFLSPDDEDLCEEELEDEGMGEEEDDHTGATDQSSSAAQDQVDTSACAPMSMEDNPPSTSRHERFARYRLVAPRNRGQDRVNGRAPSQSRTRHSAPGFIASSNERLRPDYKLLHQTRILLHNRLVHASYRLSTLQMRGTPGAHTNTIYSLQLYTYPETGVQVLFTGSKDRTVREWNLSTGAVERVIEGLHVESVLSLCVHNGYLASAGSDWRVVVWDLAKDEVVKTICHHVDSVLGVRFDDRKLVSCSKDRTVRVYSFPDLVAQFVLADHLAAVNAVAIAGDLLVSASGDRSIRITDINTGRCLHVFEGHHTRGIASIDFKPPFILSGSSDKHLRLYDITTRRGWSTSAEFDNLPALPRPTICEACGCDTSDLYDSPAHEQPRRWHRQRPAAHGSLVRSVALGEELVVSASYDQTIKVWDRTTGTLVVDLAGAHVGRIFCVGFDCTKIVSCGEDQKICIWDLSHGIDTSFIKL